MLVLSRKLNERIIIGDLIEIAVLGVDGEKVKIGVSAPKKVSVHRKEVYDVIHKENITASRVVLKDLDKVLKIIKKT